MYPQKTVTYYQNRELFTSANIYKHFIFILKQNKKKFEDTKGVFRRRNSKKNRQYNGQQKKGQKNKQWLTYHYKETKDGATQTHPKNGGE